jgi:nucleotide-binding universal stress UspA family protein
MMFHHILVPLDGSERAEWALPVAARLAQASSGTVVLLRVVSPVTDFLWYPPIDPEVLQRIIDAELEEARTYLESQTHIGSLQDVHTEAVVIVGQPAAVILSVVEKQHCDLIVLCSHGYTGMKRWVLGSVAEKVSHHAPVPVLLLREGGPALVGTPSHAEGPLRALVPLDGSPRANAALVPAAHLIAALAAPGPGALHLTHVVRLSEVEKLSPSQREAVLHKAKEYLSTTAQHIREGLVASPLAELKLAITWSVTIADDIAEGILRVAQGGEDTQGAGVFGGANLIAMATHGYSGFQRWALGSITEQVLHATKLPLLIVRPQDMLEKADQTLDQPTLPAIEQ